MKSIRRKMIHFALASGVILITASLICFWAAYRIEHQSLENAGDDPFAIALIGEIEPKALEGTPDKTTVLNHQRLRIERAAWILIITGPAFSASAGILRSRRREPRLPGISESEPEAYEKRKSASLFLRSK